MTAPRIPDGGSLYDQYLQSKQGNGGSSLYDQYQHSKTASSTPPPDGAEEGVLDKFLNMATLGIHPKIMGVGSAIGDIIQHGTGAHPIDSYEQGKQETQHRMGAAGSAHPIASTAANAAGFFAPLAIEGPIRAATTGAAALRKGLPMLPQATNYAEGASGVGAAIKRILQSAKTGAATGAVVGGLSSDGAPGQRLTATGLGGLLGGSFGSVAQGAGELAGGVKSLAQYIGAPAQEAGELRANQRIVGKLGQDQLDPTDLLSSAKDANAVQSPAMMAHLGGPSLDNQTWLASTGPSQDAAVLKAGVRDAQREEAPLIQRGITSMSGRGDLPKNQTPNFLRELEEGRASAGERDYQKAYQASPVDDPRVIEAIRNEPYLSQALDQSVDMLTRRSRANALRTGEAPDPVIHPLLEGDEGIGRGQASQIAALYKNDPVMHALARKGAGLPELPTGGSGMIPVQMLDKLKQAAQPGIELGMKKGHLAAEDASSINDQIQSILRMVDETRPDFQTARSNQASFFGREEGAKAGTKAFDQTGPEITSVLGDLGRPGQQEAYRTTATSSLRDLVNAKRFDADVGKSIFDSPESQSQLDALYGPGARERLDPYLEQGRSLNRVSQAVGGNSKTAERQASQAEGAANTAIDAAHLLTSPHRAFYQILAKIRDAKEREINQVMLQALARQLQIPANSPELPGLVEQLIQSRGKAAGRDVTATVGRRGAITRGGGLLSGIFAGEATK